MISLQNNLRVPVCYGSREAIDEKARLPKTMGHWFSEFGVTFDPKSGVGYGVRRSLKLGCGSPVRYFRALPQLGLLQICDGYFDRWANSVGAETVLPKTRAEFVAAMGFLMGSAELAKIDVSEEIVSLEGDLCKVDLDIVETLDENRDLEAYVRCFGRKDAWVNRLWRRYQSHLTSLRRRRNHVADNLRFQRLRQSRG